jgi:hypothetical protein
VRRLRRLLLACATVSAFGIAAAHATLVLGEISVLPDPPVAEAPLRLVMSLVDPALAPVEDAVVFVEVREHDEHTKSVTDAATEAPELPEAKRSYVLEEVEPGRYQAELVLGNATTYHLLVRDQTFEWEEANASVLLEVGGAAVGTLPFILPPTAIGPRSLWTWLLWLVGLPVVAGLVVTVLVLTSKRDASAEGGA